LNSGIYTLSKENFYIVIYYFCRESNIVRG
jgi:hypothetical protein